MSFQFSVFRRGETMAKATYRDLIVWQKAMELTVEIYRLTKKLPKEEMFVLSAQMRRSAISIPSNIAEGQDRSTKKEFHHYLSIARGSRAELETQLLICSKVGYFADNDILKATELLKEIGKMLSSLISRTVV
jgi:four helix bundle protein